MAFYYVMPSDCNCPSLSRFTRPIARSLAVLYKNNWLDQYAHYTLSYFLHFLPTCWSVNEDIHRSYATETNQGSENLSNSFPPDKT